MVVFPNGSLHLTCELDLPDGGALVVPGGALVGAVVALAHAPDAQHGAGVVRAGEGERRRVQPLLRVARRRPLTVRLVLPVNLRGMGRGPFMTSRKGRSHLGERGLTKWPIFVNDSTDRLLEMQTKGGRG